MQGTAFWHLQTQMLNRVCLKWKRLKFEGRGMLAGHLDSLCVVLYVGTFAFAQGGFGIVPCNAMCLTLATAHAHPVVPLCFPSFCFGSWFQKLQTVFGIQVLSFTSLYIM